MIPVTVGGLFGRVVRIWIGVKIEPELIPLSGLPACSCSL